jgi:hypothetical protein
VAETITNRAAYRALVALLAASDPRMLVITGTTTGIHNKDLNTVADLDAVASVGIHTERIALTGEAVTQDDAQDRAGLDSSNVTFAAAPGVTAVGVAVFDEGGGTDATRDLFIIYSTGFPQPMDGGLLVTIADVLRAAQQS